MLWPTFRRVDPSSYNPEERRAGLSYSTPWGELQFVAETSRRNDPDYISYERNRNGSLRATRVSSSRQQRSNVPPSRAPATRPASQRQSHGYRPLSPLPPRRGFSSNASPLPRRREVSLNGTHSTRRSSTRDPRPEPPPSYHRTRPAPAAPPGYELAAGDPPPWYRSEASSSSRRGSVRIYDDYPSPRNSTRTSRYGSDIDRSRNNHERRGSGRGSDGPIRHHRAY